MIEEVSPPHERLVALDVFRGMTVASMLLVNNPGSWSAIYPPLEHAAWHGWTPTDLIFPFFLFIVGITTHLSLTRRAESGASERAIVGRILRRGGLIVLVGLLLNAFPFTPLTRITEIRIPGVLQRIGVCYIAAALLARNRSLIGRIGIVTVLLLGYWAVMTVIAPPGQQLPTLDRPSDTLAAYVDRLLLDGHLWKSSKTWDPEGPLSTIPAIGTCILGMIAGQWIKQKMPLESRINGLFAVGSLGLLLGSIWDWVFPINKNLWTSSYVLFTAGMACVVLATCLWLVDVRKSRWWATPFLAFGTNPLIVFVGSGMMARLIYTVMVVPFRGGEAPIQRVLFETAFAPWLTPKNASLLFALVFVTVWWGILEPLRRKGLVWKV